MKLFAYADVVVSEKIRVDILPEMILVVLHGLDTLFLGLCKYTFVPPRFL
jgi:hypothetical protein